MTAHAIVIGSGPAGHEGRAGGATGAGMLAALLLFLRAGDAETDGALAAGLLPVICVLSGLWLLYHSLRARVAASVAGWTCVLLLLASPLLQIATSDVAPSRAARFLTAAAVLFAITRIPGGRARSAALVVALAGFAAFLLLGSGFAARQAPDVLVTLFASRGGLLFWHPVLWLGFVGWGFQSTVAVRRRVIAFTATALLVLAAATGTHGVNVPEILPFLGVGVCSTLASIREIAARRPGVLLAVAAVALVAWNLIFMEQFRRNLIPRDATVSFATVSAQNAAIVTDALGSPVAWPANWVFAARTGLPAAQYDLLAGRWLFEGGGTEAVIDVGAAGDSGSDHAYLGEGWGARQACEAGICRDVQGRAIIVAPLRRPSDLELTVRARGEGVLTLALNGTPAGAWPLGGSLTDLTLRVPAARWRRGLNTLALGANGAKATVDRVVLRRVAGGTP